MASETGRKGQASGSERTEAGGNTATDQQAIEHVHSIATHNAFSPIDSLEKLELFLKSWWSRQYNRPLKDPVLQSYTLHDLLYEYYDRLERERAELSRREEEGDRIEEEKQKEVLDWAAQEEQKELDALKAVRDATDGPPKQTEEMDKAWVEEQLDKAAEEYGAEALKDIDEEFN